MVLPIIFSLAALLLYILLAAFAFGRLDKEKQSAPLLVVYALASALWELFFVLDRLGWISFLDPNFLSWHRLYGLIWLSLLLLICTSAFLGVKISTELWLSAAILWGVFVLGLLTGMFGLDRNFVVGKIWLSLAILLGWAGPLGMVIYIIVSNFRLALQPAIKTRIIYWAAAVLVTVIGDILILIGQPTYGGVLRLVGTFVAGYAVLIYNLADFYRVLQRIFSLVIICLIGYFLYSRILQVSLVSSRFPILDNAAYAFAVKVAILTFLVNPLLFLLYHFSQRRVFGLVYDSNAIVRDYSLQISNILNLEKLEEGILKVLEDTMGIREGHLFLVEELPQEAGFQLESVHPQPDNPVGQFSLASPLVVRLKNKRQPFSRYELDTLPEFRDLSSDETEWLSHYPFAIYVPISTPAKWLGLLALGPKKLGTPYLREDLSLLAVLSDQTTIALENALLFLDLKRLNQEMRLASHALEGANRQLREVDGLKSAFISIVTHELRTPVASIGFALQVFEMYSKGRLTPQQRDQLDQVTASTKTARDMVDGLVNYAMFLNNQVELNLEKLDFLDILKETLVPLKGVAKEKGVKFFADVIGDRFQIIGDRKLLTDTVQQLVQNAIKYTNPFGSVRVSCWITSEVLCFDVQDTGIGIPQDKLEDVWNGFNQLASDSLRRGVEGLGLGLSLVRSIIRAHGGQVWVESKEMVGSTFGFQIPLEGPEKPLEPEQVEKLRRRAV